MLKIIGKIDIMNNLVIPYVHEDLESFRSYVTTRCCDICHTTRQRTSLWIVEIDGVRQVAGTSCLKKMFGEAVYQTAYHEAMTSWSLVCKNCFNLKKALNVAYRLIKEYGFVSNKYAREHCVKSTYSYLEEEYFNQETLEDVAGAIIHYVNTAETDSGYMANCKAIVAKEWIDDACLKFIPSMVNSWNRHQIYQKTKQENCNTTEYFGEVGNRVKEEVKASFIKAVDDAPRQFGYRDFLFYKKFYFKAGNAILCWQTAKDVDFQENEEVTFKAFTIKGQFESKLGKITSINRPRF